MLIVIAFPLEHQAVTWIIGTAPMFGYALGLSDISVTLSDGTEVNCLQKIHPVGRFIALGFAGSVRIGFAMVDTLRGLLATAQPDNAWIPSDVAEWWQEDARRVLQRSCDGEPNCQSHLMLLGVHPAEDNGLAPKSEVYVFKSPDFVPEHIPFPQVASIGSGNSVREYREVLEDFTRDPYDVLRLETVHPGAMGMGFGTDLTRRLEAVRVSGISPHLHVCWVRRGRIEITTNNRRYINADIPDFVMPNVASSWDQLFAMLQSRGLLAENAMC